jgi:hypothetical protein
MSKIGSGAAVTAGRGGAGAAAASWRADWAGRSLGVGEGGRPRRSRGLHTDIEKRQKKKM